MNRSLRRRQTFRRRATARWGLLFGALYFVQGICEPTEGLIAQPVRNLLRQAGASPAGLTAFAALLAMPWWCKPLYGLCCDFVPLAGSRRRGYLLATSLVAAATLGAAALVPSSAVSVAMWLTLLLVPTVAVAWGDVAIDALMVEVGQPRRITGLLQSVQWSAIWGATILTGSLGGYLAQHGHDRLAFVLAAAALGAGALVVLLALREPPRAMRTVAPGAELRAAWRDRRLRWLAGFLVIWNLNPFSTTLFYVHLTDSLELGEQFFGHTVSVGALGALLASLAYAPLSRHLSSRSLLQLAVGMGLGATAVYLGAAGRPSALAVSFLAGAMHMLGTLAQFDLAARVCPTSAAGTLFATLMALANAATSLGTWLGGEWYEAWQAAAGPTVAYQASIALGCAVTIACGGWMLCGRRPAAGGQETELASLAAASK